MPNIFDGFSGSQSWMDEFLNSEEMQKIAQTEDRDTRAFWEDGVINAVKEKRYSSLEEALSELRSRTGLSETAMTTIKSGVLKKTALDKDFHSAIGSTSKKLKALAQAKLELSFIASELDFNGDKDLASAVDEALKELP